MSVRQGLGALLLLLMAFAWQASSWALLPGGGRLDFMLVAALLAGLWGGPSMGAGVGFLAGGLADLVVGAGLAQGLSKALVGAAAGSLRPALVRLDALTALVVGVLGSLAEGMVAALWWQLADRSEVWRTWAEHVLVLAIAHGLLVGAAVLLAQWRGLRAERPGG